MRFALLACLFVTVAACGDGEDGAAPGSLTPTVVPPAQAPAPTPPVMVADGGASNAAPTQPAKPVAPYGAACALGGDCASGVCLDGTCSQRCDIARPNDCRAVGGFCIPVIGADEANAYACSGDLKTGSDPDDAHLALGDAVTRSLNPLKDADLYTVDTGAGGTLFVGAQPSAGVDLAVEIYDAIGRPLGIFNDVGVGALELVTFSGTRPDQYFFVVVRNVGNTVGTYKLSVLTGD